MEFEIYRIKYASTKKHEHWYLLDGDHIEFQTCILNERGARCVAQMPKTANAARTSWYSSKIPPSRVPVYVKNRIEESKCYDRQ